MHVKCSFKCLKRTSGRVSFVGAPTGIKPCRAARLPVQGMVHIQPNSEGRS